MHTCPGHKTDEGKWVNLDSAGDFITKNDGSRSLRDEVVETMGNLINSGGTLTEFEVTDTNMEIEVVGGTVGSGEQMNYSAQGSVDGEGSVITTRTELPQHGYSVEDVYVNGDLFAVISYEVDTLGNTAVTKMEGEFDANKNLINGTVTTADNSRLIVRNGIAVAKIDVQGNEFVRGDQGQWELFNGTREEENGSVVIVLNGQDIAKEDGQGNQWVMGGDGQWKILNGTVDGKTYENGELVSVEGGFAGGKPMFKILPAGGGYMTPGEGDIPPEQAGYVVFLPKIGGETPENASGGIILPMILKDGNGSLEGFIHWWRQGGGDVPLVDFNKLSGRKKDVNGNWEPVTEQHIITCLQALEKMFPDKNSREMITTLRKSYGFDLGIAQSSDPDQYLTQNKKDSRALNWKGCGEYDDYYMTWNKAPFVFVNNLPTDVPSIFKGKEADFGHTLIALDAYVTGASPLSPIQGINMWSGHKLENLYTVGAREIAERVNGQISSWSWSHGGDIAQTVFGLFPENYKDSDWRGNELGFKWGSRLTLEPLSVQFSREMNADYWKVRP